MKYTSPTIQNEVISISQEGNPVQAAFQYYADDLPAPQVFCPELFRWRHKWLNADQDLPSSAVQALEGILSKHI